MTRLLLVRHGETDWNLTRRWQGHSDTPLNETGRDQARRLASELDRVDVVYSSDLARARETAEILAGRLGVEIHPDERLRERGFGGWEGLTMDEIEERFADEHRAWLEGTGLGAADAEPLDRFAARVAAFVDDVLARHPDEEVMVVSHGGTIRAIHAYAQGLDYVRDHGRIPFVENCSVFRYGLQDGKLAPID
jgi:broad specificity phosphatase PhoE